MPKTFPNMARRDNGDGKADPFVDECIRKELVEAGVPILNLKGPEFSHSEVPYSCIGVILNREHSKNLKEMNSFSHHWDYSTVESLQRKGHFVFVRAWYYWTVSGYVPLEIAEDLYDSTWGRQAVRVGGHAGNYDPKKYYDLRRIAGQLCVPNYHIDNQEGLNLFVNVIKDHGLVDLS